MTKVGTNNDGLFADEDYNPAEHESGVFAPTCSEEDFCYNVKGQENF